MPRKPQDVDPDDLSAETLLLLKKQIQVYREIQRSGITCALCGMEPGLTTKQVQQLIALVAACKDLKLVTIGRKLQKLSDEELDRAIREAEAESAKKGGARK